MSGCTLYSTIRFAMLAAFLFVIMWNKVDASCFVRTIDKTLRERIVRLTDVESEGHCVVKCDQNPDCWAVAYENNVCALLKQAKPAADSCVMPKSLIVKCTSDSQSGSTACKSIKDRGIYYSISSTISLYFHFTYNETRCMGSAGQEFWGGNNIFLGFGAIDMGDSKSAGIVNADHASSIQTSPTTALVIKEFDSAIDLGCATGQFAITLINGTIDNSLLRNSLQLGGPVTVQSPSTGIYNYGGISNIVCSS